MSTERVSPKGQDKMEGIELSPEEVELIKDIHLENLTLAEKEEFKQFEKQKRLAWELTQRSCTAFVKKELKQAEKYAMYKSTTGEELNLIDLRDLENYELIVHDAFDLLKKMQEAAKKSYSSDDQKKEVFEGIFKAWEKDALKKGALSASILDRYTTSYYTSRTKGGFNVGCILQLDSQAVMRAYKGDIMSDSASMEYGTSVLESRTKTHLQEFYLKKILKEQYKLSLEDPFSLQKILFHYHILFPTQDCDPTYTHESPDFAPQTISQKTATYNELIVQGHRNNELIGFFICETKKGSFTDEELKTLDFYQKSSGLPVFLVRGNYGLRSTKSEDELNQGPRYTEASTAKINSHKKSRLLCPSELFSSTRKTSNSESTTLVIPKKNTGGNR